MPGLEDLDEEKLTEEVAKIEDEETASETTAEETSEEKDESTRTDTSLKTEKEETETSEKEGEETDEQPPFHTHPAWIKRNEKLKQLEDERDEALGQVREIKEIKERLGELTSDEILKLRSAGELLRKYPELAQKVQKVIDDHPYGNEETARKISAVEERQEELEQKLLLKDYDEKVDRLILQHKVDKDLEPYVKEILENRVTNQKIRLVNVPKVFEGVLKDIEKIRRKTLASHIEHKEKEPRVPISPTDKGKVVATKKESGELSDIIAELTEGLKAGSASFKEE